MTGVNLVLAAVAVLGVSASGPLMAATAAPALAIAFWRNALAAAALAPVALTTRRSEIRSLDRREVLQTLAAGVVLAAHFGTWVTALNMTSVASATAMVSLQAGFVVLIDRLRGNQVRQGVLVGIAVSFAGVLLVSGVDFSLSTRALTGDLLALAGGFFAAVYTIVGSSVRRTVSTTTYTTLCYTTCALVCLAVCLLGGLQLHGYEASTWLALVAVTVSAQLLGHSVFNHLLAVMSPTVVSLILLLEVPGAALLAGLLLDDQVPPAGVYVGLSLILAGLVIVVARAPQRTVEAPLD
jgi:drug/metabolite transporter (DMT)-like permease